MFQGKTYLFLKTLEDVKNTYHPPPSKIYFLYDCFQDSYLHVQQKLCEQGVVIEFVKATELNETDLDGMACPDGGQTIIAIDDSTLTTTKSTKLAHLFTVARHKNCSIVLMWHLIFASTPSSRIISQNTQYYFILNSPRIQQQVAILGTQLNCRKLLEAAYEKTMQEDYGYILIDLNPKTPQFLRIRARILPTDDVQHVFIAKL